MTSSEPSPIPARLARLPDLAYDLWWTWNRAREVFRRLDYAAWLESGHNPVRMLEELGPDAYIRAATDPAFLALYDESIAALDAMRRSSGTWWEQQTTPEAGDTIAYFCAEFALHQSLPIYAGGLGVLAGDHCREASDLGIPLVGVGFMYPQGYFRQRMSPEGWQQEVYERIDWSHAPVAEARTVDGKPCRVLVPIASRTVLVQVWEVRLGRVRLLLLDTDLEQNAPWDRELSARLYGGGQAVRLQQEIVLGLGGLLALRALGLRPAAWHLNEGHAAFVALQRIRDLIATGRSWDDALAEVRRTTIFTTHTPVPAGHDVFPFQLVAEQLLSSWGAMNGQRERFLALGEYDSGAGPQFNMTALAMRTAGAINAVSHAHRDVTAQMFAPLWPAEPPAPSGPSSDVPDETPAVASPITAITNGVHVPTWVASELAHLFERHLSPAWRDQYEDPAFWRRIVDIPDEDLWAARMTLRVYLSQFIRERARARWTEDQAAANRIVAAGVMLDPDALTIGFARRFTAYKRPNLIFRDPDRLARILTNAGRPVQLVFAGKAHPADEAGKHHLQTIFRYAADPKFGGRIGFVDDYDLHVARRLVQGCDVWLNTPRRPLEASGTSGMKASVNGVLHLSIGDGWWAEGFEGGNGWLIAGRPASASEDAVDAADAESLYWMLENAVIPKFYERDARGLPRRWLAMIKQAMLTITPRFSARRMVKEYVTRAYIPALTRPAASGPSRASSI